MARAGSRVGKADSDYVLTTADLQRATTLYLDGADAQTPLASPIYGDMTELPPLLIQIGVDEILLDDATGLAEKARAVGVDVSLQVWERMYHVWQTNSMIVPEGWQALGEIGRFFGWVSWTLIASCIKVHRR
jgi:acetyl esterase/lipase